MSTGLLSNVALLMAFMGWGIWLVQRASRRAPWDVVSDMQNESLNTFSGGRRSGSEMERSVREVFSDELASIGLYGRGERKRYSLWRRIIPPGAAAVAFGIALLVERNAAGSAVPAALIALACGYLFERAHFRSRQSEYVRNLEFFLPVVMERLVMAVKSGLDVISGLKAIVELEKPADNRRDSEVDPVTRLLDLVCQLTEAGLGFEEALCCVAELVKCTALRHAFLHLAMAWREGGELVMPLSELSDSTQLYFQESVEEEIARLPVKATMPLLLTFTGLLICFITSPLIQVMSVMEKALPKQSNGQYE